jgi:hypothetical protein
MTAKPGAKVETPRMTATSVVHRNIDVRLNVRSRCSLGGAGDA